MRVIYLWLYYYFSCFRGEITLYEKKKNETFIIHKAHLAIFFHQSHIAPTIIYPRRNSLALETMEALRFTLHQNLTLEIQLRHVLIAILRHWKDMQHT